MRLWEKYIFYPNLIPHKFSSVKLKSTSPFTSIKTLAQNLETSRRDAKDAQIALETFYTAVRNDQKLKDKTENKEMIGLMNHYKEYFDVESGNTKKEGLEQLLSELKSDFSIKKDIYVKAKVAFNTLQERTSTSFLFVLPVKEFRFLTFFFFITRFIFPALALISTLAAILDIHFIWILIENICSDLSFYLASSFFYPYLLALFYFINCIRKNIQWIRFINKINFYFKNKNLSINWVIKKVIYVLIITIAVINTAIFIFTAMYTFIPQEWLSLAIIAGSCFNF